MPDSDAAALAAGAAPGVATAPARGLTERPDYNVAVGYLRGFVRFLVFGVHSMVAYFPGPEPAPPMVTRLSIPIWDPQRFAGARIFVGFNEITAMSLMFFLSGLVMWPSLSRKGAGPFLRERVERLGLPFLVSAGLLAGIAYYPAYLLATGGQGTLAGYFSDWMAPSHWMPGPAWFLPMLFVYDVIAALVFFVAPKWGFRLGDHFADAQAKPLKLFAIVIAVSLAAYVPLAVIFGPYDWWGIGPIWVQKCRALQYGAYFFLGAGVGAYGLNKGLVAKGGQLAKRWGWWALAMLAAFVIVGEAEKTVIEDRIDLAPLWGTLTDIGWVICCATCSFALLAIFIRFGKRNSVLDSFANNSYGIYLVHYPLVTWLQFALLSVHISPILKAIGVLVVAVGTSWAVVANLRRIPAVRRIV